MNTKHLSTAALLFIAATFAGCAGDEKAPAGQQGQQPDTKGMTEFAVVEQDVNAVATRTSGEYTGAAVKFYWTSNDQLWINNTASASPLKASNHSTIPTPNGKEATAKFWFEDRYTASDYPVRYTGNSNTAGDKVIIKSAQAQQAPNEARISAPTATAARQRHTARATAHTSSRSTTRHPTSRSCPATAAISTQTIRDSHQA